MALLPMVADHQKWTEYFGCERVIHRTEANRRQGTDQAERKLEGSGPWLLDDDSDVQIIHTPGMLHADRDRLVAQGTENASSMIFCCLLFIRSRCRNPVNPLGQDTQRDASRCCTRRIKRCSRAIIWLGPGASVVSAS